MPLTDLSLLQCGQVRDLTPLKGMKLTVLNLYNSRVADLTPLKGMKLTVLSLYNSGVADLTPLEGMKLERIALSPKRIMRGLEILRQLQSLKTISPDEKTYSAAEFWKRYHDGEFKK
jgi:Leucine-rich repeat (LRR) protein